MWLLAVFWLRDPVLCFPRSPWFTLLSSGVGWTPLRLHSATSEDTHVHPPARGWGYGLSSDGTAQGPWGFGPQQCAAPPVASQICASLTAPGSRGAPPHSPAASRPPPEGETAPPRPLPRSGGKSPRSLARASRLTLRSVGGPG